MIHHRAAKEVRRFDIFKLIITLLLLFILFLVVMCQPRPPVAPEDDNLQTAATAETPSESEPTGGSEPTEESEATAGSEATEESEAALESEPEVELTAPTLDSPTVGDTLTSGEELTFSGTGTPDSEVEVVIDGESADTITVDDEGAWSSSITFDAAGEYEVSLNALDAEGNVAATSEPITLAVEAPAVELATPTLDSPSGEEVLTSGEELTFSGTGTPDSEVEVVIDGESAEATTVDDEGAWSSSITFDEAGEYEVSLNALDPEGKVAASSEPVTLAVGSPAVELATPTLDSPSGDEVLTSGEELTFSGTGTPDSEVEVVIDGESADTTTVDDEGAWSSSLTFDEAGEYEVNLNALDTEGNVAATSDPIQLTVEAPAFVGHVCQENYVVEVDDWLSKLADKYWQDIFLYPAIVSATNQKQEVDDTFATIDNPDLIEPGWKLCIVDADTAVELSKAEN